MLNRLLALLLILSGAAATAAEISDDMTPEEKGYAIAKEADERDEGFVDSQSSMKMILINKRGDTSERELRIKTLEGTGDEGDKSLLVFDTPKDQKGTALLTFSHKDRDDDQWLYLPALGRVKKIASKSKSGPFLGSEFSFEDMGNREIEKYDYKWLRDEKCDNGMDCYVIERIPLDEDSGYTKMIAWIDKKELRNWKTEYYDRKKTHQKTLTISDYNLYNDQYWRPTKMVMVNHQTGKSTRLEWDNYEFGVGLSEHDFNKNVLKRIR